ARASGRRRGSSRRRRNRCPRPAERRSRRRQTAWKPGSAGRSACVSPPSIRCQSVRRKALVLGVACAGALTLAGSALGADGGTLPVSPRSPNAQNTRDAYIFVLIFTAIVFVGVEGALIALMIKYRRGRRARSTDGLQLHGSTRLEILWTVVPVLILTA